MRNVKINMDCDSADIFDENGEAGYSQVDWKASPEEVLEEVESFLQHFGLEVTIGDGEDDQVYFKINTKKTDFVYSEELGRKVSIPKD